MFTRRGDGNRVARPLDIAPVRAAVAKALRDFERYELLESKVCHYTVSEDERFVVEPIGAAGWLISACSGHGFKLSPLITSGLADVLSGTRDTGTLPAWAAGRRA